MMLRGGGLEDGHYRGDCTVHMLCRCIGDMRLGECGVGTRHRALEKRSTRSSYATSRAVGVRSFLHRGSGLGGIV
jgi:hypothetical protein